MSTSRARFPTDLPAAHAIRWLVAEGIGKIRRRRDRGSWFIDLRPYGRVYGRSGIPFRRKKDAERILSEIRGKLAHRSLPEVLSEYLPASAKPNRVPTRLSKWLEVKAAEVLPEMLGYCFEPRQEHERFVDGLIGLLGRCRILRFRYRGVASAREMLAELSAELLVAVLDPVESGTQHHRHGNLGIE